MRIAFLDLETTGLPKQPKFDVYHSYTQLKYYENARIVQIALLIYDVPDSTSPSHVEEDEKRIGSKKENVDCKLVAEHTYVVKPDGFEIRNSHIHRIDTATALFAGIEFKEVINKIWDDLKACDVLIAHNILFDKNVLLSELHRYGFNEQIYKINAMKYFCTSKGCTNITRIRYNLLEFKQPKLSELYKFLFKKELQDAHDALVDTKALVDCFMELRKRRLIVCYKGEYCAACDL